MISRVLEWYQIVDTAPKPDTVDRRIAAVTDLVKAFDDLTDWDIICDSITGLVRGFEAPRDATSKAAELIYQKLHAKDSTVPQDLTRNALELRAACGAALCEIVSRDPNDYPDDEALVVSSLFIAAMNLRPPTQQRYVKAMLDEFADASRATLERAQRMSRRRTTVGKEVLAIDENAETEPEAAIKVLTTAAKQMANAMSQQAAIDREELDILWWLFSEASRTFGSDIKSLPQGKAAFVIGSEIATMCLTPPPANAAAFVRRGCNLVRKADTKKAVEKFLEETDAATWALLHQGDTTGKKYPVLCPLTWLCSKLAASNVTTGWGPEFHAATGLEESMSIDVFSLAQQVFLEKTALRIISK